MINYCLFCNYMKVMLFYYYFYLEKDARIVEILEYFNLSNIHKSNQSGSVLFVSTLLVGNLIGIFCIIIKTIDVNSHMWIWRFMRSPRYLLQIWNQGSLHVVFKYTENIIHGYLCLSILLSVLTVVSECRIVFRACRKL